MGGERGWVGGVWTRNSAVYQSVKLACPDPVRAAAPSRLMSHHAPLARVGVSERAPSREHRQAAVRGVPWLAGGNNAGRSTRFIVGNHYEPHYSPYCQPIKRSSRSII